MIIFLVEELIIFRCYSSPCIIYRFKNLITQVLMNEWSKESLNK